MTLMVCKVSLEHLMDGRLSMGAGKAYPRPFRITEANMPNFLWLCFRAGLGFVG